MASCDLGDDLAGVDPSCLKVYVGEVPLGWGCNQGECVPAAYCDSELVNLCAGKCVQRLPAGSSATQLTQCELGLVLVEGKCTRPRAEGESCDPFASTQPTGCAPGLFCTGTSGCKSLKAIGATCTNAYRCAFGRCSTAGTCVCRGDIGATCGTNDCKIDLVCAGSLLAKCEARKPRGAACTNGSQCEPGLRCADAADGGASGPTCVARLNEGEACSAPLRECANANFCDLEGNHTCKARLELGAACTEARACKSSFCTRNVCSPSSLANCK